MKPAFITFTGADDGTDPVEMAALSSLYPVEFGVLLSSTRMGSPRYPGWNWITELKTSFLRKDLRLSLHLCGQFAREAAIGGGGAITAGFDRVQINVAERPDTALVAEWAARRGVTPILQCREAFPNDPRVSWLLDASGGRGISPLSWPAPQPYSAMVGYAGGLGLGSDWDRIAEAAEGSPYWVDMETNCRDGDDRFDLALCRAICEEIYN